MILRLKPAIKVIRDYSGEDGRVYGLNYRGRGQRVVTRGRVSKNGLKTVT